LAYKGRDELVDHVELKIVAEHTDESLLHRFIEELQRLHDLPSSRIDVGRRPSSAFELRIRYPLTTFDHSVGQFMAVLFGEIPFMRAFGQARFEDLMLPAEVYSWFHGPSSGAFSVLERFGPSAPPLLVAILKPSLDLSSTLEQLERRIVEPLAGGFHAVKDDETQGDFPNLPLNCRLELASRNHRYIPAVNLDDPTALRQVFARPELGMVMVSATILGFPFLHELSKIGRVPILSHLSMQGLYATCFSNRIYALLHRLFGSDALITPIGDTHYYRASKADECEMVNALTAELPIAKTLPLLTGGGRMDNLPAIVARHEATGVPYGIVLGGLIFNSDKGPRDMAHAVVRKVAEVKQEIAIAEKAVSRA
jgi:ribulose 1,5-bisphosphate carboxylase large subunit-like protein